MTTYTTTADSSGNYSITFGTAYTGGQKVSVTSEKDGSTKNIELYAPSSVTGGGAIQFSGNLTDFPKNIGNIILKSQISGEIAQHAFYAPNLGNYNMFDIATGLVIDGAVTKVGIYSFGQWRKATLLTLPNTLLTISDSAFRDWVLLSILVIPDSVTTIGGASFLNLNALTKLTLGSSLTSIGINAFSNLTSCNEIIVKPLVPPSINSTTFSNLKSACVIKVPASSLAAYQTATNWSVHASKMVGV